MRLIDGDEVLVNSQNDAYIELWNITSQVGEMVHGAAQHLFGAFDMKTQIALAAVAELFLEMRSAIPAIGVWPEMKHTGARDITKTRDHLVKGLSAIRLSGEQMYPTSRTKNIFAMESASFGTNPVDFPGDD